LCFCMQNFFNIIAQDRLFRIFFVRATTTHRLQLYSL